MKYLNPQLMFTILVMLHGACNCFGQSSLARYLTENFRPPVNVRQYPAVKFNWNIPGNVQTSMNEGLTNLDEEKFTTALVNFGEVIEKTPTFWPSYYYRGVTLRILGKFDEAEKDFVTAISLDPGIWEMYVLLGEVYQIKRQFKVAAEQFTKALALNPSSPLGKYGLGNIAFHQDDFKNAEKHYEDCINIDPTFASSYLMIGLIKIKNHGKRNTAALELLNKALAIDSTISEALFWRGLIYLDRKEKENCLSDWNKVVQYKPEDAYYLMFRGLLHVDMGDFDRAFNDLRKTVLMHKLDQNEFKARESSIDKGIELQSAAAYAMRFSYGLKEEALLNFKKGFCFFIAGYEGKSLYYLREAAKVERSAPVYYLQAVNYDHSGLHDSAFVYYKKALDYDKNIFDAHRKCAIYRYQLGDWLGAYQNFDEMLRLEPTLTLTYRLRGFVKGHQGDYRGAVKDLDKYLSSDPTDIEALKNRGYFKGKLNDSHGELEDYKMVLQITPGETALIKEVAYKYLALADTLEGLKVLSDYQTAFPTHFDPYRQRIEYCIAIKKWTMALEEAALATERVEAASHETSELETLCGLVYENQGNLGQAIFSYTKAISSYPSNFKARYFRGKCYIRLGLKEKAKDDFRILKDIGFLDSEKILKSL